MCTKPGTLRARPIRIRAGISSEEVTIIEIAEPVVQTLPIQGAAYAGGFEAVGETGRLVEGEGAVGIVAGLLSEGEGENRENGEKGEENGKR